MHRSPVPDSASSGPFPNSKVSLDQESDALMRRYIRHPSSVPIDFDVIECGRASGSTELVNVSRGGVCFASEVPLPLGARVQLEIPIDSPPFEIVGRVAWCKVDTNNFLIGISFDDSSSIYSVRMVEQVCYIEHYRTWVQQSEGRQLSSEEAAREWIERYAEEFPKH